MFLFQVTTFYQSINVPPCQWAKFQQSHRVPQHLPLSDIAHTCLFSVSTSLHWMLSPMRTGFCFGHCPEQWLAHVFNACMPNEYLLYVVIYNISFDLFQLILLNVRLYFLAIIYLKVSKLLYSLCSHLKGGWNYLETHPLYPKMCLRLEQMPFAL